LVLGAVVATTDAIAATSIAKRVGLPQRVVDILEGESLVNDATGLLALEFSVAIIVQGQTPTPASGFFRLIYLIAVGIGAGLVIAFIIGRLEPHLDDAPIEIMLSIMIPYAAYLGAEALHASGVLAVVACGLYLGRRSNQLFSPDVRLQVYGFWNSFTFALNGIVFVLIGLQLPFVLAGIKEYSFGTLLLYGASFSALVIVLRLIWMFPGAYVANFIRRRMQHQKEPRPPARAIFVIGWTGMRGVLALAAALSLPETLANGNPFPQRNLIIFLTFSVILVTLVLQGLTLPSLIRALGLAGVTGPNEEQIKARRIMLEAALQHIELQLAADVPEKPDALGLYEDLAMHYRRRLASVTGQAGAVKSIESSAHAHAAHLSRRLIRIERDTAVRLRNEGYINDEALRHLERELDLSETRLDAMPYHH
jgi:CPA1 family monovalent cation:H+ antiporter